MIICCSNTQQLITCSELCNIGISFHLCLSNSVLNFHQTPRIFFNIYQSIYFLVTVQYICLSNISLQYIFCINCPFQPTKKKVYLMLRAHDSTHRSFNLSVRCSRIIATAQCSQSRITDSPFELQSPE